MIEAQGLHKRYGDVVAVDDVSFRAENGAITGLLGVNGAGKTTSLRLLGGLVQPDRGMAQIDGRPVGSAAERHALGMLPDSQGLYPRLTVREHLLYYGRLHGLGGGRLEQSADRWIERFGLTRLEQRRVEGFSTGERRKVALARALVHDPPNVVLDEPQAGLDVLALRDVRQLLRDLADEGRCVVFSSHVMQEVEAICDRLVIIDHGRACWSGTAAELRRETGHASLEDAFVALVGRGADDSKNRAHEEVAS